MTVSLCMAVGPEFIDEGAGPPEEILKGTERLEPGDDVLERGPGPA